MENRRDFIRKTAVGATGLVLGAQQQDHRGK